MYFGRVNEVKQCKLCGPTLYLKSRDYLHKSLMVAGEVDMATFFHI